MECLPIPQDSSLSELVSRRRVLLGRRRERTSFDNYRDLGVVNDTVYTPGHQHVVGGCIRRRRWRLRLNNLAASTAPAPHRAAVNSPARIAKLTSMASRRLPSVNPARTTDPSRKVPLMLNQPSRRFRHRADAEVACAEAWFAVEVTASVAVAAPFTFTCERFTRQPIWLEEGVHVNATSPESWSTD